ncbi:MULTISPECIES: sugar ABC transporter ATP-binding protein [unclassified Arcicella]|uniref:sugar ABC transporter ATP-binding protein n=1 Tax=unclassified Arcicella TaxID=2644986 RepID=UPI002854BC4E|nr:MULTISPECIES: sugar ABC transporter ATP-binding protein [unclassified Arcicella]MDR6562987.1 ribose transport system ATP-binding protein [Arcicella sp. BE51]MDR6813071.1 ribose transport system ATP-binding protein [Arcicella sp. BE140]MDR6824385.1 ribose transport system ATP-binding protein [Arcicella sp. BE139]
MTLSAKNITKRFSGVTALDAVCIDLQAGKVNAIIGENGAGKSTLMKILSGVYTEYEGTIYLQNKPVKFTNTKEAENAGIAIIHQELNMIPYLSVVENIFLGREVINAFGLLDKAFMLKKTQALLQKLCLNIDPNTPIRNLKVGQQQLIEIAKALLVDAKVIIMDEPTSAITGAEVDVLFRIIDSLKAEGKAIAYISHKLDELFKIADTYTVLRDGKSIESGEMSAVTRDNIVSKMVGRELVMIPKKKQDSNKTELLRVNHLGIKHESFKKNDLLNDISFVLHKGEILGIFGLMGAGRTELFEAIFGLAPRKVSGEVLMEGQRLHIHSPSDAVKAGLALVSEDRKKDGIVPELSVKQNICITTLPDLLSNGVLDNKKENNLADKYIQELRIKTSSSDQLIKNLSGGNQQKAILAKWLATKPKVLLLDEPTRGIDVNAKAEIYKLINQLAESGLGIIMISSELPEIFAVSDRVIVLSDGKVTGDYAINDASEEILLKAAIA